MFVRLALEEDIDAIVEMGRAYAEEAAKLFQGVEFDEYHARETFYRYLDKADPTIFVVEKDRQIVGFMAASFSQFMFSSGVFTTADLIYVKPENRGSRAAFLLVKEFDAWSDTLKAKMSFGGNSNALYTEKVTRLYESQGYRVSGASMVKNRSVKC